MVISSSCHLGSDRICVCELCVAHKNLRFLLRTLGTLYNVTLDCPRFLSFKDMKEHLAGALLPGSDHHWSRALRRFKIKQRLSILGSLFLFRKTLPSSPPSVPAYVACMSEPSPPAPLEFHTFIRKEIGKMFPVGWDRGYGRQVESCTLSVSSCLESRRKDGGVRALVDSFDRSEFCGRLMELYGPLRPRVNKVKLALAQCDGKQRLVTINSKEMSYLMPLHHALYAKISKEKWCLKGEAMANRFRDFTEVDGEVFVSGDYESATDNLNQSVQTHILYEVLSKCRYVPHGIRRSALDSLSCDVSGSGFQPFRALRGQMMGNALSFPLLCLVNYLIFRYFVRRDVPVKINGDDIVFRATRSEYERWSEGVRSCGLTLSAGKTVVARRWFSLNSTFFVANKNKVKMAAVVRSTVFTKKLDDISSLKGRFDSFKHFDGRRRSLLTAKLLARFATAVWFSQRSIRRGLEIYASDDALEMSHFAARERYYLDLPKIADPPLPVGFNGFYKSKIPEGWVRRAGVRQDPDFIKEMIDLAWKPEAVADSHVDYHRGTFKFNDFGMKRMMKLLGFKSRRKFMKWRMKEIPRPARSERMVWAREGSQTHFVAAA